MEFSTYTILFKVQCRVEIAVTTLIICVANIASKLLLFELPSPHCQNAVLRNLSPASIPIRFLSLHGKGTLLYS
jgi:hypothetical protein